MAERSDGFIEPDYGQATLSDVLPGVLAALGHPGVLPASGIELPDASAYVVFLIDGLGATLLHRHADWAPYLSSLTSQTDLATAGVPSTTATSLTSLGTALPPGAHGLVGFTSRLPGTDRLLNALAWDKRVDPSDYQPHPTAFARARAAGVTVTVVNKREFAGSGLTLAGQRGVDYVGADRVGERIAAVVSACSERPALVYMYDGDLDWTGHRFGVGSSQWRQQLATIDAQAEQAREALPDDVRLLVVADHGMVDCPPTDRFDLAEHPQLRDGLALLGGEARFRHLYCRQGAVDDLAAAWREQLADRAVVLTRAEAVARGWFGAVDGSVLPRLGDIMVAARGDFAVFSSTEFAYEASLVGLHGSLTHEEMLIPLLLG